MTAPAVIFVCGRNAVRSPMAEALYRRLVGEGARASSCGVEPAGMADGYMISVMAELGEDLSDFDCRDLADAREDPADLVVCLAADVDAEARAFAEKRGARYALWPIEDPTRADGDRFLKLAAYRAARDAIEARISALGAESA
ncbi:MAG: low molecular weight phosphatase family protein [Oceanicaulis sp.]